MGVIQQKQESYKLIDAFMEHNSGEVVTIQDDSYSIKELLERFVKKNMPEGIERTASYSNNPSLDEVDVLSKPDADLVDAQEFITGVKSKLAVAKKKKKAKEETPDKEGSVQNVVKEKEPDEKGDSE